MPNDLERPFTEESLRELYDHVTEASVYGTDRELAAMMYELYWGKHVVKVPDTAAKERQIKVEVEKMYTQEAAREINLIASFYTKRPIIGMRWYGEKTKAESVAEKLEEGLTAAVSQMDEQFGNPRLDRVMDQLIVGKGAQLGPMPGENYYWNFPESRTGETSEAWEKRYEQWWRAGPLPFAYVNLPADSAYPASLGMVKDLTCATLTVSKYDLIEMFGTDAVDSAMADRQAAKAGDLFTLFLASNRNHLAYCVMDVAGQGVAGTGILKGSTDRIIRRCEHNMGQTVIRIPPGVTGSKYRTSQGQGHYWLPVLYFVAQLVKAADRLFSMAGTAQKFDALPVMGRWTSDDIAQEGAVGDITRAEWGDIMDFAANAEGKKLSWMEAIYQPRSGEKTQQLLGFVLDRCGQISGAHPLLEGQMGQDTAWVLNEMIKLATGKFSRLSQAIQAADEDDYEMVMRSIKQHKHPVKVMGDKEMVLLPEQMENWRPRSKVQYEPNIPKNQLALWQTGMAMMEKSITVGIPTDPFWIMQDIMGREQPVEDYKRWVSMMAMLNPALLQRQMLRYLDEWDALLNEEDEAVTIEEIMAEYAKMSPQQQGRISGAVGVLQQHAAQGARRAGSPFTARPGGPTPEGQPNMMEGAI